MSSPVVPLKKNLTARQTAAAASAASAAASTVTRIIQEDKNTAEEVAMPAKGLVSKGTAEIAITEKISDLQSSSSSSMSSPLSSLPNQLTLSTKIPIVPDPTIPDDTVPDPIVPDSTRVNSKGITRSKVSSSQLAVPPVAAFGRVGRGKNKKYRNSIEPKGIVKADVVIINNHNEKKSCNEITLSNQESATTGESIVDNLPITSPSLLPLPAVLSYAAAASRTTHGVNDRNFSSSAAHITAINQGVEKAAEEGGKQGSGSNILSQVRSKTVRNNAQASLNLIPNSSSTPASASTSVSVCIPSVVDTNTTTSGSASDTYSTGGFIYSEEHNTMFGQERGDGGLVKG